MDTLFEKTGKANWLVVWHQDTALPLAAYTDCREWGPWSRKAGIRYAHAPAWALGRVVALRLHLDNSSKDNGPLRVIPGSHRSGVLSDDEIFQMARRGKVFECLVPKGGVLVMSPLLIHSSSKALVDSPRRILHFEYASSLTLTDNLSLAIA